jgi:hypothetical protein
MITGKNIDWILTDNIDGSYIYQSPDRGKTIKKRPSGDHPINVLASGQIPIDTWYKLYGSKNGTK